MYVVTCVSQFLMFDIKWNRFTLVYDSRLLSLAPTCTSSLQSVPARLLPSNLPEDGGMK